jgi:hypothetical protein
MVFIPHGMDQMFTQPESSLFPEFKGLLARCILATPAGRERYRERCAMLFTNVMCPSPTSLSASGGGGGGYLSNKVVELQQKLCSEIATLGTNAVAEHGRAVAESHQEALLPAAAFRCVPHGRPTIARRFIAGFEALGGASPRGTIDDAPFSTSKAESED